MCKSKENVIFPFPLYFQIIPSAVLHIINDFWPISFPSRNHINHIQNTQMTKCVYITVFMNVCVFMGLVFGLNCSISTPYYNHNNKQIQTYSALTLLTIHNFISI